MKSKINLNVRTMYFMFIGSRSWKGFNEKQRCRWAGMMVDRTLGLTTENIAAELLKEMIKNV